MRLHVHAAVRVVLMRALQFDDMTSLDQYCFILIYKKATLIA